eukprot:scaffold221_cov351-Pavlova_lutheri.AAC.15
MKSSTLARAIRLFVFLACNRLVEPPSSTLVLVGEETGTWLKGKTIGRRGSHPNRKDFSCGPGFVYVSFGFEKFSPPSGSRFAPLRFERGFQGTETTPYHGTPVRTYPGSATTIGRDGSEGLAPFLPGRTSTVHPGRRHSKVGGARCKKIWRGSG